MSVPESCVIITDLSAKDVAPVPPLATVNVLERPAALPEYPDDVIVPNDALSSLNVIVPPSAFSSMFASASRVMLPEPRESISAILGVVNVLLVRVSVDTKDTKVELEPAGSVRVLVTPSL